MLHTSLVECHLGDMHYQMTEGNDCTESLDLGNSEELQHVQQALMASSGITTYMHTYIPAGVGSLGSSPYIEILSQPQSRGYRFRYKCEGQSHGGLQAEGSGKESAGKRMHPTISIRNFSGPRARVRVSLVTADDPARPHAHELIGKHCSNGQYSQELPAQPNGDYIISFSSLSIQHATRKSIPAILKQRLLDELQSKESHYMQTLAVMPTEKQISKAAKDAEEQAKTMETNAVRLKFEVDMNDNAGVFHYACALSTVIHDSKSTTTNPLKISRIDKQAGSCIGGDEVFLLCSKVQKDDIRVKFYEQSDDDSEPWIDYGKFSPTDVHRQYAIVFKTPPYKDRNIQQPVEVCMLLCRPSDCEESEPRQFTYHPHISDQDGIGGKRRKPTMADWEGKYRPCSGGPGDTAGGSSSSSGGGSAGAGGSGGASGTYGSGFSRGARSSAAGNIVQRLLQPASAVQQQHLLVKGPPFLITQAAVHGGGSGLPALPPYSAAVGAFNPAGIAGYQAVLTSAVKTERPSPQIVPQAPDINTFMQQQQSIDQMQQQQQQDDLFNLLLGESAGHEAFQLSSDHLLTDDGGCELPVMVVSSCMDERLAGSQSSLLPLPERREAAAAPDRTGRESRRAKAARHRGGTAATTTTTAAASAIVTDDCESSESELWPAVEECEHPNLHPVAQLERNAVALQNYACSGDVRFLVAAMHHLAAARNDAGDNSIHLAVIHNQQDALCSLLSAGKLPVEFDSAVNQRNDDGQTPLHIAAILGLPRVADMLLRAGADVSLCDRSGSSAWHLAAHAGDLATLRVLAASATAPASSGVNHLNYDGLSPLHLAVKGGHAACVALLVASGADVDVVDGKCGRTALHFAVEHEQLAIVGYLVTEASADVNQPRFDGNTALHIACCLGLTAIASLLVAAGADADCENYEAADAGGSDDGCDDCASADGQSCDGLSAEPVSKRRRGNTPLDLAGDNEQILSVLRNCRSSPARTSCYDEAAAETHQVVPSVAAAMLEGLDSDVRASLATELSVSPLAWARLADAVGLGRLVAELRIAKSPGSRLLDSYEAFNGTVDELRTQMMKLNLDKAVAILDGSKSIGDGRLDSGVGTSLTHSDSYRLQSWEI